MLRTAAIASAALRRAVLASSRPSILGRAFSAGPTLSRWPDASVHRPVSRPFPLPLDLSRGYAGGLGKRFPYDEGSDDLDDDDVLDFEDFVSDDEEIWDDSDGYEDVNFDQVDFSGELTEESK